MQRFLVLVARADYSVDTLSAAITFHAHGYNLDLSGSPNEQYAYYWFSDCRLNNFWGN